MSAGHGLGPFRRQLDELDEQIRRLLGERFAVCRDVARYKLEHGIPVMQPGRMEEVKAAYIAHGTELDLPAEFTEKLYKLLIDATCQEEDELIASLGAARFPSATSRAE
jgi:chorismate mutase